MPKHGDWEWDELLTAQEVADLAGVHLKTFRRWLREGEGPTETRLGPNTQRFASSDVQRWLTRRKVDAADRVA